MAQLPYYHVDAFADRPFTGNQAAVMPLDSWPHSDFLRSIGEENNFAETAFYVPDQSDEADYELRWFTPTDEIRLCGHATLASGHILLTENTDLERVRFRTRKAGILEVWREGDKYAVALPANEPKRSAFPEAEAALGTPPLETHRHPDHYNVFLYETAEEVINLDPDIRALGALGDDSFTVTAPGLDTDIISRVFVPGAGVDEDSVTGSAHSVLTPFWAKKLGWDSFTAYQASKRGGYLTCRLEGDRAILIGDCVTVVEGSFFLPDA
jgi:PhzF family phenazine biosynthesis protein